MARAKNTVFCFGITKYIENLIRECTECKINSREDREQLQMFPVPNVPWEIVGMNLFLFHDMTYLIVVDYLSRYIVHLR